MKIKLQHGVFLAIGLFSFVVCACAHAAQGKRILLGFVQVSSEGTWRMANTQSVKDAAAAEGIDLIVKVGQDNRTNQTEEMSELIASGVDVLAFAPSQAQGWDAVLRDAKEIGIPVIVLDRAVDVKDRSLYLTHIGSDMVEEGRRAARWLISDLSSRGRMSAETNVLVLEGIEGSTPAVHRDQGFREVLAAYPNVRIVHAEPADFIMSKGREVTEKAIKGQRVDVVFAHNDEMALGAVEALKAAGKAPGKDVVVIGVDAISKALEAIIAGEMNATVECSPLLGPQLMRAVKAAAEGRPVESRIVTEETVFDITTVAVGLRKGGY